MGQKTNPIGLRLGIIKPWESRWFSEKDYSKLLQEDIDLRKFLFKKLSSAGISKIVIERTLWGHQNEVMFAPFEAIFSLFESSRRNLLHTNLRLDAPKIEILFFLTI